MENRNLYSILLEAFLGPIMTARVHLCATISSCNGNPIMLFIMFPSSVSNKMLYTSCFPPDVDKYAGYETILESSGFGLL